MLGRIILQLRTARYLKPSQLYYYIRRRYLPAFPSEQPVSPRLEPALQTLQAPCPVDGIFVDEGTFRFLNVARNLAGTDRLDWLAPSQSRLWQYNLHYFDYLRESARSTSNKSRLIESWVFGNRPGSCPGWEPFTTSLRIVNWIFYFRQFEDPEIPASWLESLFLQARWLERNDERHILANHYFENLKALLFAGCYFAGHEAERWRNRAIAEIPEQLAEQTLPDGGHYERSPQYHCLMLENYLDIYNLGLACPDILTDDFMRPVRETARQGLAWLADVLFPDSKIPLFNDSAFGVSVTPDELFSYADRLGLEPSRPMREFVLVDRPESGYYGCRTGDDMFIIDCGDIGPSYQPGHTHCDFLSYELMLAGERIVVDTGVFEYEPGPLREHVRSTKAHNTVAVDGDEQSEVWSAFRVARRARKISGAISATGDTIDFSGSFRGFHRVKGGIAHERRVKVRLARGRSSIQALSITDTLTGAGLHSVESYIHLHPSVECRLESESHFELLSESDRIAVIDIPGDGQRRIESTIYCPEFGIKQQSQVLIISARGALPLSLTYEINRVSD